MMEVVNNLPDTFTKMAKKSNQLLVKYLSERINIASIYEEPDVYSANDLLITLKNGKKIMIEGKVRNKKYTSYMMDYKKLKNLRAKEQFYRNNNVDINDIWYVNIVEDDLLCFSLNKLRDDNAINPIHKINDIMSATSTAIFFESTNSNYLVTYMFAPVHTATNGNYNLEKKMVVLFNQYSAIPTQTMYNYEYK